MREAELVYKLIEDGYTEGHVPTEFVTHLHVLRGAKGAVTFSYVFPRDAQQCMENLRSSELSDNDFLVEFMTAPMGRGVDYHSPVPLHDWQTVPQPQCAALGTGPCYGDGSGLRAQDWMERFQTYGPEWLIEELVDYYHQVFYDEPFLSRDERIAAMGFGETVQELGKLFAGLGDD